MREFNWKGYDRWLDHNEREINHIEECNCSICHEWHIDNFMVEELAKYPEFKCCKDELK